MTMTRHAKVDRAQRYALWQRYVLIDQAYVLAYYDCGCYNTSGKYECHELWSNGTVRIINKDGKVITVKFLVTEQLWRYYNLYYEDLYEYGCRNENLMLNWT